tara:strand:- start:668 stop:1573 length:906 start_codon:yes stop_codon:yes gene_type:complete
MKILYVDEACDICGSKQAIEIKNIKKYTNGVPIHICNGCSLVAYRKRATPEEMAKFWEEIGFKDSYKPEANPEVRSRHFFGTEFIKKYIGYESKLILDIGAGEGQFLEIIKNEGGNVFGIESSGHNCELLKKRGIPYFHGTVEAFDEKEFADVATIVFTLQNSQSATKMIMSARDLLKNEGHIMIEMGSRIMVPFKKPMGTYFSTHSQNYQPYHFSISTIQRLLAKCGFVIKQTNNYWDDNLMCVIAKKVNLEEEINLITEKPEDVFAWFERWDIESNLMKKYVKFTDTEFSFFKHHTFYK